METTVGIVREWIKQNDLNGGAVIWSSDDVLKFTKHITVKDLEQLALFIDAKIASSNNDNAKCNQPKPSLCEKRKVEVYCTHDKDCFYKHFA